MKQSKYVIEKVEDLYWHFAWKQVQTFIVTHLKKEPVIIYIWVKDSYNIAFRQVRHFLDYMCGDVLDANEEIERFDFEDIFDYDSNGAEDPFKDFIISIVENKYNEWEETAYSGKYLLKKDEINS